MVKKTDILDDRNLKELPFRTPEGYFEDLKLRLESIPEKRGGIFRRYRLPALAHIAAGIVLAVLVGRFIFISSSGADASDSFSYEYSRYLGCDLIPVTDPYLIQEMDEEEDYFQDIVDYLISDGTSADMIAYILNY